MLSTPSNAQLKNAPISYTGCQQARKGVLVLVALVVRRFDVSVSQSVDGATHSFTTYMRLRLGMTTVSGEADISRRWDGERQKR